MATSSRDTVLIMTDGGDQEMFLQRLAEDSHNQAKLERKPRRNIQYKDVGMQFASLPPSRLVILLTQS
jgi:hypothetical protein